VSGTLPILYHNDMSACAQKARLAFAAKGVAYESRHLSLVKGETRSPEYLAINPAGQVPALVVDGGRMLVESTVIMEYVDDAFEGPPLKPDGAFERARARLWMRQLGDDVHRATAMLSGAIAFRHRMRPQAADAELRARAAWAPTQALRDRMLTLIDINANGVEAPAAIEALRRFVRLLADIDAALHDTGWLAGSRMSLADLSLLPYILRLDQLALSELWRGHAAVAPWYDAMRATAAFAGAIDP
jgi:glutathione S-transferase